MIELKSFNAEKELKEDELQKCRKLLTFDSLSKKDKEIVESRIKELENGINKLTDKQLDYNA